MPQFGSAGLYACLAVLVAVSTVGPRVQAQRGAERVRVIIGFQQAPGALEVALVQSLGGTTRRTFWLVPAVVAEVPEAAVEALRRHPAVTSADLDAVVTEVDAELDASWGVKRIGAGMVHDNQRGFGVRVCVIDSGVDRSHPDLAGSYQGGYDFVNSDDDPSDDRGHGTHVAGIIAARDNGEGVVGVAPEAGLLAYKILDQNGQGYISNAIAALEGCVLDGGHVTNSSFGTQSDPGSAVQAAYDKAAGMGLINVAAAGNQTSFSTCNSIAFPARYASVIAVTATDSSNKILSSSCRGAEAELAAPGASINSTVPTGSCYYCSSGGYRTLSGTSMASPHVAGAAALTLASGLAADSADVRLRLQSTADDLGTAGRDSSYGYGLVDADEAALPPPPPPEAPSNLGATAASSSQINLAWTDNATSESGFRIERCTGSGCTSFALVATVGANATSYANTGLQASTTYTYRVQAYNSGGASAFSNGATATTLAKRGKK